MTLLILRPEPGGSVTAGRAASLGLDAVTAPLFAVRKLAWELPDPADHDAVMLTSANAVRHGGRKLRKLTALPAYAVGIATAEAARGAGFETLLVGDSDGAGLLDRIARAGITRLLHLTGREHRALAHPDVRIDRRIVYASDTVAPSPALIDAVRAGAIALLHSPRAAAEFARVTDAAGIDRATVRIVAISARALAAAGPGWRSATAADTPGDDALLALAAGMCD